MVTYPILACVWCACMFYFMFDISNVVEGWSLSHLLVGIYMMYHSPPLPI